MRAKVWQSMDGPQCAPREASGILFQLDHLPDLSLTRYAVQGITGIDVVLQKHNDFLRQFSRKPGIGLHLIYAYAPEGPDGARLRIHLLVSQTREGSIKDLGDVEDLVAASPLSAAFKGLVPVQLGGEHGKSTIAPLPGMEEHLLSQVFSGGATSGLSQPDRFECLSVLVKSTGFMTPSYPCPDAPHGYYVQPDFKENESSRLFSMMKLMESLGQPCIYRVDLYPVFANTMRSKLPINAIRKNRESQQLARDFELEGVERSFERLLERLESSRLFNANVCVLSQDGEVGRAILEAAASEAIEKGSCDVACFRSGSAPDRQGAFLPLSLICETGHPESLEATAYDGSRFILTRATTFDSMGLSREGSGFFVIRKEAWEIPYSYMTTLFTLEEASSFFRFPVLEDGEFVQCPKETAPKPVAPGSSAGGQLFLGRDLNGQKVYFEMEKLKKHAFISGVPGSGKTVTMCHLVTSLVRNRVPFLVLEPAKREYRAILNDPELAKHVLLFSPGANTPFPLRINPFEMPVGVSVGHHINRLRQVFEGSFPLESALPFLLDRAIESVYQKMGWNSKMVRTGDETLAFPTLTMLYDQMQEELQKADYDKEVAGNLKSAVQMRIGGLLRRELGDIFDVPTSTVDPGDWVKLSVVLELEGLGASESNFLTLLLCVLVRESLMDNTAYEGDVRHVIFIEEAHNLIGPEARAVTGEFADPKMAATAFLSDMLREVRALGEGIVIADQLPTAIAPEVLKNTGLKVALRITSTDDRELLGSMMTANPAQLESMAVADPGSALIMYEGLQRPFEMRMSNWLADPEVEGYIPDDAKREQAKSSQPNKDLQCFLRDEVRASWYESISALAVWIDACSMELRAQPFLTKIETLKAKAVESGFQPELVADDLQERGLDVLDREPVFPDKGDIAVFRMNRIAGDLLMVAEGLGISKRSEVTSIREELIEWTTLKSFNFDVLDKDDAEAASSNNRVGTVFKWADLIRKKGHTNSLEEGVLRCALLLARIAEAEAWWLWALLRSPSSQTSASREAYVLDWGSTIEMMRAAERVEDEAYKSIKSRLAIID